MRCAVNVIIYWWRKRMDKQKGFLEKVRESDSGKNIMFLDRRNGKIMGLASTLNLIVCDTKLSEQYEIRKVDGNIYIQSKPHIENLD